MKISGAAQKINVAESDVNDEFVEGGRPILL